jgi:hypothetical protein
MSILIPASLAGSIASGSDPPRRPSSTPRAPALTVLSNLLPRLSGADLETNHVRPQCGPAAQKSSVCAGQGRVCIKLRHLIPLASPCLKRPQVGMRKPFDHLQRRRRSIHS